MRPLTALRDRPDGRRRLAASVVLGALAAAAHAGQPATVTTSGAVTGLNVYPLGTTSNFVERYQQVYDADMFDDYGGPVTIVAIAFRTTAVDAPTTRSIDLTLRASNTNATPASLSSNYDVNVGGFEQTIIFDDTFTFTTAGDGTFDVVIPLSTPYTVQPGERVLLDFDTDSISGGGVGFEFHANSPSTGRVFTIGATGQNIAAPFQGLLTRFTLDSGGPCPGDVTGDGVVDFSDLNAILAAWGTSAEPGEDGDEDEDGDVDFEDLNAVLAAWGAIC